MTITIEAPTDIADLIAEHPHAVCTPMLGAARVLPPKATPVAKTMEWNWTTITRIIEIDGAHIRIGNRAKTYPLEGGRPVTWHPGDTCTLIAELARLKL